MRLIDLIHIPRALIVLVLIVWFSARDNLREVWKEL